MLLVDFLELLKLVALVNVAKETTVATDRHFTCLAEIVQFRLMLWAKLFSLSWHCVLLLLHQLHHVSEEATRD